MNALSNVGIITALTAGAISFLSPCVLSLVPGYLSYIAGESADARSPTDRTRTVALSLCFVLGFSIVFVALGATASAFSRLLLSYRYEANLVGGAIVAILGLFMTGLLSIPWLMRDFRMLGWEGRRGKATTAILLGMAFGLGWTPCIGPVLGAILTVSALSQSEGAGIALLAIYSAGLGLPFLLSAIFTDGLVRHLRPMRRLGMAFRVLAGGVMMAMGALMITGYMSILSFWLLDHFPILARIG